MAENQHLANPDPTISRLVIGCGYLGRRIAALWQAQCLTVFGTTRNRMDELSKLGITPVHSEVMAPESLRLLPACATVVYCIGFDRRTGHNIRQVVVEGLKHVLASIPA